MFDINFILIGLLLIMMIFITIYIFAATSSDITNVVISIVFFLILLLPFSLLMNEFNNLIIEQNYDEISFFKMIPFFSTLINTFIGLYLFIEAIYVQFFS